MKIQCRLRLSLFYSLFATTVTLHFLFYKSKVQHILTIYFIWWYHIFTITSHPLAKFYILTYFFSFLSFLMICQPPTIAFLFSSINRSSILIKEYIPEMHIFNFLVKFMKHIVGKIVTIHLFFVSTSLLFFFLSIYQYSHHQLQQLL